MTSSSPRKEPIAGVSVLVVQDGRVLLVKRGREPSRGLWALPGGRIEPGESAVEAAAREVAEETAVVVDGLRQIDTVDVPADATGRSYRITVFAAEYRSGTPKSGDDAAEALWVAPDEVAALPLTDGTRALLATHGTPIHA